MEATRQHIAAKIATEKHTRTVFRDACAWFMATYPKTEMPYSTIYEIVTEELAKIAAPEMPSREWPVMLTKEEAEAVAKAVGGNDKAEDIKAEIMATVAVEEVVIKEA